MHRVLLGFVAFSAAIAVSPPVQARDGAFVGRPAPVERFGVSPGFRGDFCRDFHRDRDRGGDRRRFDLCRTDVLMSWYGGEWAVYNNRSWESDSYNDWWHDRPDRAFPRWVRHNRDCTPDRMWWSGQGWHC